MEAPTESTPLAPNGTELKMPTTICITQLGKYFGFRYFHLRMFAIAPLSLMVAANISNVAPFLLEGVQDEFGVSNAWVSLVYTGVPLGSTVGVVFFGAVSDLKGRKYTILVCVALIVGLSLFCLFLPTGPVGFPLLVIVRVLQGVPYGGLINLVTTYAIEFSCDEMRGITLVAVSFAWAISGVFSLALIGACGKDEWRLCFAVAPLLPGLLFFICSTLLPESPRWLRVTGSVREAHEALDLVFASRPALGEAYVGESPKVTLEEPLSAASNPSFADVVRELFSPALFQITVVSACAYGILAGTGNAVETWAPRILRRAGGEDPGLAIFSVGVLVGTAAALFVCFTLDRIGRRPLIWAGCVGHAISFAGLAAASSMGMAKAMFLVHVFSSPFISAALTMYITEAFPTSLRTSAMGITTAAGRFLSVILPAVLGWLFAHCSTSAVLLLVCASYVAGLLVSLFIPSETARQAMNDSMPSKCA